MMDLTSPLEPDPVIDASKKDVDRTLLRENLRRTVQERFEMLIEGAALRMSPEFWLNAQQAVDIYHATRKMKKVPGPIPLAG